MNVSNIVAVVFLLTCVGFVKKVSSEEIQCWECSTITQQQCGHYDRVGDQELTNMTKVCKPIGFLTRACYRTVIIHHGNNIREDELRLFCGPAMAHDTVCNMIDFFMSKLETNLSLTHCSVCSLPLCNIGSTHHFDTPPLLVVAWLAGFVFRLFSL